MKKLKKPQLSWPLLRVKIILSLRSLGWLMSRVRYTLLAIALSLFFFEFVYWMFNLSLFGELMLSGKLSVLDKLGLFVSPFTSIQGYIGASMYIMMLSLAVAQGVTLASLVYIVRHQPTVDSRLIGGSTITGLLAVIGLGCPACGTSLVTPIVALFVSGSAVAVAEVVTAIALPIALVISVYGLYAIGLHVANTKVRQEMN